MSSSSTVTATAPLAITTPFVQPPGCESLWSLTSVSASNLNNAASVVPVLVSEPAASCYPSGWDDVVPENRLTFSPGVCPSGWTYHLMGEEVTKVISTAYCCNSGYTYLYFEDYDLVTSMSERCGRWVTNTDALATSTSTGEDNQTAALTTLMLHEAWALTWAASDTSTLSPQLPTLTSAMRLPTWTPGEVIPDGKYDNDRGASGGEYLSEPALWFLMVGIPIIGAILIGTCIWGCVRQCRKSRRNKAARAVGVTTGDESGKPPG